MQQLMQMGKLVYPTLKGFECIPWNQIRFLEAEGNYTRVHTTGRKTILSQTLKKIEDQLPARLSSVCTEATWSTFITYRHITVIQIHNTCCLKMVIRFR